ncbi:hypothetical protein [Streptomyces sp. NPDC005890]|uniref:hypothetical protein n=1 Tax=Streptomyces sp. NPDC005890 TaxID=3154568 RepID=UPI0033CCD4B2
MVYLATALMIVAALCARDLTLSLAVLRRLLDRPSTVPALTEEGGISVVAVVEPFSTQCSEGVRLTERDLTDDAGTNCPDSSRRRPGSRAAVRSSPSWCRAAPSSSTRQRSGR